MRKHYITAISVLSLMLLSLPTAAWAEGDPGFWDDPFEIVSPGDNTPDPDLWDDPFLSNEAIDNLPEPEFWIDPFEHDLTAPEYDLFDTGLPANINEIISRGTALKVNVYRNMNGGKYNTLCLPFAVPDLAGTPLEGSQVLEFEGAVPEGTRISIYFHYVYSLEAGRPYLVLPPADVPSPMSFEDVILTASEGERIETAEVDFAGILEPFALPDDGRSLFLSSNKLYYSNGAGSMRGLRAYFYVKPSVSLAPARICIGRPVATGVENTEKTAVQAGKYIADGLFIIRLADREYNVQGVRVK